ncbi:hypothetical protein DFH07DRAFT_952893 [Mycena maculata]|uniref:Uncharacterized protein n=1 Tax=Mycena maculata TaxID=230809 RepID=A0AAD7JVP7_9AGAR|nr:hypothetical protein DFH07DRAFT_952893 [Mycena maculata]
MPEILHVQDLRRLPLLTPTPSIARLHGAHTPIPARTPNSAANPARPTPRAKARAAIPARPMPRGQPHAPKPAGPTPHAKPPAANLARQTPRGQPRAAHLRHSLSHTAEILHVQDLWRVRGQRARPDHPGLPFLTLGPTTGQPRAACMPLPSPHTHPRGASPARPSPHAQPHPPIPARRVCVGRFACALVRS